MDLETLNLSHVPSAGFFSNSGVALQNIIFYFNKHKKEPTNINTQDLFIAYKSNYSSDIFPLFFKRPLETTISFTRPIRIGGDWQYFPTYENIDFEGVSPFIAKYFSPSDDSLEIVESLEAKYRINYNNTVSVFYRGNDKHTETTIASYDTFFSKCDKLNAPNIKFLVQTDELEFRNEFVSTFSNSFYFEEMPVINKNQSAVIHNLISSNERPKFGLRILSSTLCVSRCNTLVTHSGNCGVWAALFRGNGKNIHQYIGPDKTQGSKQFWY